VPGVSYSREIEKGVEIHVKSGDRVLAKVVAVAESADFAIADLSVAEPSLETVFIKLTGKELRD
jgi:ABC-2 type transport system ATP-binding protein